MSKPRRDPHETAGVFIQPGGITAAPPEKGRSRDWEKRQRQDTQFCVVTFRHLPVTVRDRINAIAETKGVNRDEVARKLLEFALAEHEKGRMPLEAVLRNHKLTLFSDEQG